MYYKSIKSVRSMKSIRSVAPAGALFNRVSGRKMNYRLIRIL